MARYSYPLPRRYRVRYPYRYRKGGTGERAVGVAVAVIVIGAGGGTVTAVHHHAASHKTPAAASGPAPVLAAAGPGESGYIAAVLGALAVPGTISQSADSSSLAAWIAHETPWPPVAEWNAMNTTLRMPGSSAMNSVGVQSYPSEAEGVQAIAETLLNGYPLIVTALRSGAGLCGNPSLAGEFLAWSGGGYPGVC